jgi:hypothetical protein
VSDVRNRTGSFFDLYSQGQLSEDAIDDFVGAWHGSGDGYGVPLSEFLGLTEDEYGVWVMDARALPVIRASRSQHQPLHEAVTRYLDEMRNRTNPQDRSAIWALSHWAGQGV